MDISAMLIVCVVLVGTVLICMTDFEFARLRAKSGVRYRCYLRYSSNVLLPSLVYICLGLDLLPLQFVVACMARLGFQDASQSSYCTTSHIINLHGGTAQLSPALSYWLRDNTLAALTSVRAFVNANISDFGLCAQERTSLRKNQAWRGKRRAL